MDKFNSFLEMLVDEQQISLEEMPAIDLYMDQVIQLFENKYSDATRHADEKVLTKTMINNYAKGKLFVPIKNKKYSKEHLILISLIYQLKGALTIKDIKNTLDGVNEKVIEEQFSLDGLYKHYLALMENNREQFKKDLQVQMKNVQEELLDFEDEQKAYLEKMLLVSSLVNMSNYYRRVAEKLVDEIVEEKE